MLNVQRRGKRTSRRAAAGPEVLKPALVCIPVKTARSLRHLQENHSLGIIIYYKDHLGVSAAHSFERPGLCLSGDEAGRRMLGQSMLVTGSRRWPC